MAWTTLDAETAILDEAATSPRVAVDTIGQSVEGRPIRRVRIGDPTPPASTDRSALLVIGCQHGHEPAGREAMLTLLLPELIATTDAGVVALLASHGVTLIPTANPDGFAAERRENTNIVDLNRDHVALTQPETRALALALGDARPLVVLDTHETGGTLTHDADVAFRPCSNPQVSTQVQALSDDLLADVQARMTADSWAHSLYGEDPPSGRETRMLNNAALRHSVPLLIESHGFGGGALPEDDRRDIHYAVMDEAIAYLVTNAGTVESDIDAGIAAVIAEGAAGTAPFDLHFDDLVIDPPPLGYQLTVASMSALAYHLRVYNLHRSGPAGLVLSMAQLGQPILPHLVDTDADDPVEVGTRLFTLPAASVVGSVGQFAAVISGSHAPIFEARLVDPDATGPDPDGDDLPVIDGHVILDGTADVQGRLDLTTRLARFPRRIGDQALPDGSVVFVRRGVDLGDTLLWAPLGYFRVEAVGQPDAPDGEMRLVGYDRMRGIIDSPLLAPRQFAATATFGSVFADLVGDVFPTATIVFDDELEFQPLGRLLVVEQSRHEPLKTLAQGRGKIAYWDGAGVLQVRTAPDPSQPLWEVRAGRGGVLSSAQREISRTDVVNAVVVRSQGLDTLAPARAAAIDDGPNSITRFGGRFGVVPEHITIPAKTTAGQARQAAVDTLLRRAGLPYRVEYAAVPNAALRPYDPVRVTLSDGTREKHVNEVIRIPLRANAGAMTARTREQRLSRIRAVAL
jgi:hypothetical protein